MSQEKISIIVPVRNASGTVGDCLTSLCSQTYRDIEIIVVYRESEDETLRVLEGIKDPRLRMIKQTDVMGPGAARNMGIDQARGEWIGFVEADDIVGEGFYAKLMEEADKETDIMWGEVMLGGKRWVEHPAVVRLRGFEEKFACIENGASFDKLFRADLIRRHHIRFAEGIHWEDNLFLFRAFYHARQIVTVPGVYYTYRPSSWSAERRAALQHDVVPAAEGIVAWAKELEITGKQRRLIDRKVIESFVDSFLADEHIYRQMVRLMGHHWFLVKTSLRYRWKKFKRQLFHKTSN